MSEELELTEEPRVKRSLTCSGRVSLAAGNCWLAAWKRQYCQVVTEVAATF